jgi:phospholipid transport system substrate-binding protein
VTHRSFLIALGVCASCFAPAAASAQAEGAMAYVQRRNAEVDALMARPATTDAARETRDRRISALIDGFLDYDTFARRMLGAHWAPRSAEEQREYQSLLTTFIQRQYRSSIERLREYTVEYLSEETTPDGMLVHARARSRASRRAEPIEMDYAMHLVEGHWRVFDITTNQTSLLLGQGARIRRMIAHDGWAAFMTSFRETVEHPERSGP